MPTYIRVKQIDPDELQQYFIDSITSNSGQLINYINQNSINLTGDNFISGDKYFNNNLLVSGTGSFLELYLRSNSNTDTGVRFLVTGDDFNLYNRSGAKFVIRNIESSPYTGKNTIELTNNNTTLKIPSNKNDFIAVNSEVMHVSGDEIISGKKSFLEQVNLSETNIYNLDTLDLSGVNIVLTDSSVIGLDSLNVKDTVRTTGNQLISGIKNFDSRPTVGGLNIALQGEANSIFNGNRAIKRTSFPAGLTIGGNDVSGFLNNLFFPFVPATISLNSYNLRELGTTSTVLFVGSVTVNDETSFSNLQYYNNSNGSLLNTVANPNLNSNPYFSYNSSYSPTSDTSVKVKVTTSQGDIQAIQNIDFQAPMYYGVGAASLNETQIKSTLTKQVEYKGSKTRSFTASNQKLYIVYSQSWGLLTSITDPNGFPNINGWSYRSANFALANNSSHAYYIYESNNLNSVSSFNLTFNF